ncbi:sigma factor-like helix-turn-helix DNA-binding protein [Ligilactobacillus salivarius]|nr:sigma factor-like helix-turn-helix DNA-binding protein [Ligilactobacillus salivarius]
MKSAKRNTWSRETLLRAVVLYYEKKMTQEEVSNELGVSRPQVSVMLSQAREDG